MPRAHVCVCVAGRAGSQGGAGDWGCDMGLGHRVGTYNARLVRVPRFAPPLLPPAPSSFFLPFLLPSLLLKTAVAVALVWLATTAGKYPAGILLPLTKYSVWRS